MKKLFILFVFLFIPITAILFVQCSEPVIEPTDQDMVLSLNRNLNPGGGEVESAGNNLSFPAFLADGYPITPVIQSLNVKYTDPYSGLNMGAIENLYVIQYPSYTPDQIDATIEQDALALYPGLTMEEINTLRLNGHWYAQKVEGNVWQADYETVTTADVYFIDWGDMMESVDPKVGTPYRVEFGVYVELSKPMSAYTMALLAYPSSKDETQGTNGIRYDCGYATIASPLGKCVIQRYDPGATLTWNAAAGLWEGDDVYAPEIGFGFAQELNVGGKFIFGASNGGFKPTIEGEYRITFYFQEGSTVSLAGAQIGDYNAGDPIIPKEGERNTAVVDDDYNITYMDVTAIDGGRSGMGKGGD